LQKGVVIARFPSGSHADDAWAAHTRLCIETIARDGHRSVCEIGGGRKPLLDLPVVRELGVEYTVMDVSQGELDRAPEGYSTECADICDPAVTRLGERYDVVLSRMVAEHVPDGAAMHRNVLGILRPGGVAFHFFPTLYTPVFVANRLMPDRLTDAVQRRIAARDEPKFPARYSLCRGPTPRAVAALTAMGYEVEEYRPFYGTDYLKSVPVLGAIDDAIAAWAARRRNPWLTSYAFLRLRKPARAAGA
jgi:SAM-dependent methyltransferase